METKPLLTDEQLNAALSTKVGGYLPDGIIPAGVTSPRMIFPALGKTIRYLPDGSTTLFENRKFERDSSGWKRIE